MAQFSLSAVPSVSGATARVALPRPGSTLDGSGAGVMVLNGDLWLRVSAQIYNELDDYRSLAETAPRGRLLGRVSWVQKKIGIPARRAAARSFLVGAMAR